MAKLITELAELLERQIEAARADDMPTAHKLAEKCSKLVAVIGRIDALSDTNDDKRKITKLYRQLECILTDKVSSTRQQLRDIQQGQKLLGAYRP